MIRRSTAYNGKNLSATGFLFKWQIFALFFRTYVFVGYTNNAHAFPDNNLNNLAHVNYLCVCFFTIDKIC